MKLPLNFALVAAALCLTACQSTPAVIVYSSACSELVKGSTMDLRANPVVSAPLPEDDASGAWAAFGDAQTGRLDTANRYGGAGLDVIERCEARDKDAAERLQRKPFWRRLFGG